MSKDLAKASGNWSELQLHFDRRLQGLIREDLGMALQGGFERSNAWFT